MLIFPPRLIPMPSVNKKTIKVYAPSSSLRITFLVFTRSTNIFSNEPRRLTIKKSNSRVALHQSRSNTSPDVKLSSRSSFRVRSRWPSGDISLLAKRLPKFRKSAPQGLPAYMIRRNVFLFVAFVVIILKFSFYLEQETIRGVLHRLSVQSLRRHDRALLHNVVAKVHCAAHFL